LLQCGVGKLNAAASTAALLSTCPDVGGVINVGIAGSQQPIGESFLAHQIQDAASGQQWFPHLPAARKLNGLSTLAVLSVDSPAQEYSADTAFDMEASGIFAAATKILDLAFVQSLKVISDNEQSSIEAISAESVSTQIKNAIPIVEQLINALPFHTLPVHTNIEAFMHSLLDNIHYTETEQHALRQLLHRHKAVLGHLPEEARLLELGSAKAIRHTLGIDIDSAPVSY